MRKADGILCGDIHIRETVPVCRTEVEFYEAQWLKLDFISDLQKMHQCPVMSTGDFYHHWKTSPELTTLVMQHLPKEFISIYGDHDLPQHSWKLRHKSGLTTLAEAGYVTIPDGGHGFDKSSNKLPKGTEASVTMFGRKILLWHLLTWKKELPYPGCTTSNAKKLLKKYPQFDLIVTGDNHKPFTEKHKGRLLVNVGSMMRQSADQVDYHPAVWLYYAKENEVVKMHLPIEKDVVSRDHLEKTQQRNDRIDAFVGRLNSQFKVSLDFGQNLEQFYSKNKVKKSVKKIIQSKM